MKRLFASISATPAEVAAARAGDDVVAVPDIVMDRAFTLGASAAQVWPWLVQLGKQRAGWYLPRSIERFLPRGRRALRMVDRRWQGLAVGDVIPDYGGRHETFDVVHIDPPHALVYASERGHLRVSWSLTLTSGDAAEFPANAGDTRLHLRLRLGSVRHRWLVNTGGELLDAVTIAGMAAGLRERVGDR